MSLHEVKHRGSRQHPHEVTPAKMRPRMPRYVQDPKKTIKKGIRSVIHAELINAV